MKSYQSPLLFLFCSGLMAFAVLLGCGESGQNNSDDTADTGGSAGSNGNGGKAGKGGGAGSSAEGGAAGASTDTGGEGGEGNPSAQGGAAGETGTGGEGNAGNTSNSGGTAGTAGTAGTGGTSGAGGDGGMGATGGVGPEPCNDSNDCNDDIYCNGVEMCIGVGQVGADERGCIPGNPIQPFSSDADSKCPDADGLSCTDHVCDPNSDECRPIKDDTVCDDGLYCNQTETCDPQIQGHDDVTGCVSHPARPCSDGISCTIDSCDEANDECDHVANALACADANQCDGAKVCNLALGCIDDNQPMDCDDGIACTDDDCFPLTGCAHDPEDELCDDGVFCDGNQLDTPEVCDPEHEDADADGCLPNDPALSSSLTCVDSDGIACKKELCNEAALDCVTVLDNSVCGAGENCTGESGPSGCVGGGQTCTLDSECDDGQMCNGVETCVCANGPCSQKKCKSGPAPACSDSIYCTADSCDPAANGGDGGCVHTNENDRCLDSNQCNGTEVCNPANGSSDQSTGCVAGTPVSCPSDGRSCTIEACVPQSGACVSSPDHVACNDNNACTTDSCVGVGGQNATTGCSNTTFTCPGAESECFVTTCDPQLGCRNEPDDSLCAPQGSCQGQQIPHCDPNTGDCVNSCNTAACQGKVYKCGNCLDDDGDCKVDSRDEHCLGPCSDNEAGYRGEISGQDHGSSDTECYWDNDSGTGNDGCNWDFTCDPYGPEAPWFPYDTTPPASCNTYMNTQSAFCFDPTAPDSSSNNVCGKITPNGCDCFGCCYVEELAYPIFLGSQTSKNGAGTCNFDMLGDLMDCVDAGNCASQNPDPRTRCRRCTQVTACTNTCENCEVCFGKPEVPDECTPEDQCPGNAGGTCPNCGSGKTCGSDNLCHRQACGLPGQEDCPNGFFCTTGCCVPLPQ